MWYADSYHCPKTFDEYIERVTSAACLPAGKAREILREHAVSGRSKLDSYEAVDFVMKYFPERYEQEVEKVVKYPRWLLAHGLELGYDSRIGWSVTKPGPALIAMAEQGAFDACERELHRIGGGARALPPGGKSESSTRKYVCPCCGMSVRATREVRVICMDCDEQMVRA